MCTLNCCKWLAISHFLSIIASLRSYLKHSKPMLDFLYPTWHRGNGRLFAFASMWFSCWRLGLFIARLDCTSRFLEQKKKLRKTHALLQLLPTKREVWCFMVQKSSWNWKPRQKDNMRNIAVIVNTLGHGDLSMKHLKMVWNWNYYHHFCLSPCLSISLDIHMCVYNIYLYR